MAISQFSKPSEQKFLGYDTNFLARLGEYSQKKYEDASNQYDDLLGAFNKIPALEQDVPKRKEIVDSYRNKLSEAYKQSQGDYTKMLPTLKRLKNDYQNDMAYGPISAITGNYSSAAKYNEEIDKALEKGTIDATTASTLKHHANTSYLGIGEQDQFGRFSGKYQGKTPAKNINLHEKADKLAEGWKADKVAREGVSFKTINGNLYTIDSKGHTEKVDGREIQAYVQKGLSEDPEVNSFVQQKTFVDNYGINQDSQVFGLDQHGNQVQVRPDAYLANYGNNLIADAAKFAGAKYGYSDTFSGTSNLDADPYALKAYEKALSEQESSQPGIPGNLPSIRIPQNDNLKVALPNVLQQANNLSDVVTSNNPYSYGMNAANYGASKATPDKITFNSEQEKVIKRAEKEFGRSAGTPEAKAKLLNEYIDYHNAKLINLGFNQIDPSDKKQFDALSREQKTYFGDDNTGNGFVNKTFIDIGGTGERITGQQIADKYGDNTKYTKKITGTISPDNPYTPNGRIITITDNSGKVVNQSIMELPADARQTIEHQMYKAKTNATGESTVQVPVTNEKGEVIRTENLIVKYNDESDDLSNNDTHTGVLARPFHSPNVNGATVEIYEPGNKTPIIKRTVKNSNVDVFQLALEGLKQLEK